MQEVLSRARGGRTTFSRSPFFWTLVIRSTSEKSRDTTSSCMIPCPRKHKQVKKGWKGGSEETELNVAHWVHGLGSPCCLFCLESSSSPPAAACVRLRDPLLWPGKSGQTGRSLGHSVKEMHHGKSSFTMLERMTHTDTQIKNVTYYLVNFFADSLHLISLHPLSRDGESELLVFELQVVIDAFQEAVHTGQLKRRRTVSGTFVALQKTNRLYGFLVSDPHHASERVLHMRVLGVSEHGLKQQGVLGDPLVGFGLHVPKPHPLTLRMSLHPLGDGTKTQGMVNVTEPKTSVMNLKQCQTASCRRSTCS